MCKLSRRCLIVLALGALLLSQHAHWWPALDAFLADWWPPILIAIGVVGVFCIPVHRKATPPSPSLASATRPGDTT